jgi:hypothetical protein
MDSVAGTAKEQARTLNTYLEDRKTLVLKTTARIAASRTLILSSQDRVDRARRRHRGAPERRGESPSA